MVMRISYSDNKRDENDLKVKWIDNKTKYRVLIKNVYVEYRQKIFTIYTETYFSGSHMEESVQELTTQIRQ